MGADPIPRSRVHLEARLIRALEEPPGSDAKLIRVLDSFDWQEHRELACIGLAGMARRRRTALDRRAIAESVIEYCLLARGDHCSGCPLERVRRSSRRSS